MRVYFILLKILFLSTAYCQVYKIEYNGDFVIGFPNDMLNIDAPFLVYRTENNNRKLIYRYDRPENVGLIYRQLKSMPEEFGVLSDTLCSIFSRKIWDDQKGKQRLDQLQISSSFKGGLFGLGLAFSDKDVKRGKVYIYEIVTENKEVLHKSTIDTRDFTYIYEHIDISPVKSAVYGESSVLHWKFKSIFSEYIYDFKVLRQIKGKEDKWSEIKPVFFSSDSIGYKIIGIKDTTVTKPGIYSYVISPRDEFLRVLSTSAAIDWYKSKDDNIPLITFFDGVAAQDLPYNFLRWKIYRPEEVDGVLIERSAFANGSYVTAGYAAVTDTGFTDIITEAMETYFYRISLVDRFGRNLPPSPPLPVVNKYRFDVLAPHAIQALSVNAGVEIFWVSSDYNNRGFYIHRKAPGADHDWQVVSPYIPFVKDTMSYLDTVGLDGRVRYEYAIKAVSMSNDLSDYSNIVAARPDILVIPEAVSGLSIKKIEDNSYILTWENVFDQDIYVYQYQLGIKDDSLSDIKWLNDFTVEVPDNFIMLESIKAGAYYTVRAKNVFGYYGSPAYPVKVPDHYVRLRGPEYITAEWVNENSYKLRWNRPLSDNIISYQLYSIGEADRLEKSAVIASEENTEMILSDLAPGVYRFVVSAVYQDGKESDVSEPISIVVD